MLHKDVHFAKAVEDAVARIETRTDAEIVVVASAASGRYTDVAMLAAAPIVLVVLAFFLFSPWSFSPLLVLLDLVVVWPVLVWLFLDRRFLRFVVPRRRQAEEVRRAAESEFVREAVFGTPNRTGVLVYVSALEGRTEVIPDVGVEARLPKGRLAPVCAAFAQADVANFIVALEKLGELLATAVPHTEESDRVDLSNAPRIRK